MEEELQKKGSKLDGSISKPLANGEGWQEVNQSLYGHEGAALLRESMDLKSPMSKVRGKNDNEDPEGLVT